jgi:hypothetical protein
MKVPMRPAAYLRLGSGVSAVAPARQRQAIIDMARARGWPEPTVYADDGSADTDGYGPALERLSAAIGAGRHDAVIMPGPAVISRNPAHMMAFLVRCTHHGVAVEFLSSPGPHVFLMRPAPPAAQQAPPLPVRCTARTADVLTRAGVEALSLLFPDWRIWADGHGWHARRRGDVYLQTYQHGAPAFCVHAFGAVDLAAQLRWQQAADVHTPAGCSA